MSLAPLCLRLQALAAEELFAVITRRERHARGKKPKKMFQT